MRSDITRPKFWGLRMRTGVSNRWFTYAKLSLQITGRMEEGNTHTGGNSSLWQARGACSDSLGFDVSGANNRKKKLQLLSSDFCSSSQQARDIILVATRVGATQSIDRLGPFRPIQRHPGSPLNLSLNSRPVSDASNDRHSPWHPDPRTCLRLTFES